MSVDVDEIGATTSSVIASQHQAAVTDSVRYNDSNELLVLQPPVNNMK